MESGHLATGTKNNREMIPTTRDRISSAKCKAMPFWATVRLNWDTEIFLFRISSTVILGPKASLMLLTIMPTTNHLWLMAGKPNQACFSSNSLPLIFTWKTTRWKMASSLWWISNRALPSLLTRIASVCPPEARAASTKSSSFSRRNSWSKLRKTWNKNR